MLTGV